MPLVREENKSVPFFCSKVGSHLSPAPMINQD
jgi:hypothetical protein